MPVAAMSRILDDASKRSYAVGCFNAINLDMIRGVIKAAEIENSPVILCHAEIHFKYTPIDSIGNILRYEAEKAKIPVSILLDHGKSIDTVKQAIKAGFNAVMIDASSRPYEENMRITKEAVDIAHAKGVEVESELGYVTRPKSQGADGDEDDSVLDDITLYTKPEEAEKFVNETNVDALAVAFGTSHGVYIKKPELDFQRLREIRKRVDLPLVMHGGSGLNKGEFSKAIRAGIVKINYYTGMAKYVSEELKKYLNEQIETVFYHNVMLKTIDAVSDDVRKAMRLFGSSNKGGMDL